MHAFAKRAPNARILSVGREISPSVTHRRRLRSTSCHCRHAAQAVLVVRPLCLPLGYAVVFAFVLLGATGVSGSSCALPRIRARRALDDSPIIDPFGHGAPPCSPVDCGLCPESLSHSTSCAPPPHAAAVCGSVRADEDSAPADSKTGDGQKAQYVMRVRCATQSGLRFFDSSAAVRVRRTLCFNDAVLCHQV